MKRSCERLVMPFIAVAALGGCGGGGDTPAASASPSGGSPPPAVATSDATPQTPGTGTAAALCGGFDFFYTAGNKAEVSYRVTGGLSATEDWTITTVGNAMFEGREAFQVNVDTILAISGGPTVAILDKQFTRRTGQAEATVYGSEQLNNGSLSRTVMKPPMVDARWGLSPGQSLLRTYHVEAQVVNGETVSVISATDGSSTDTFVGVETVTVPAGTFSTCRFEERDSSGGFDTLWLLVGTTVMVKFEFTDSTRTLSREATRVLINGAQP